MICPTNHLSCRTNTVEDKWNNTISFRDFFGLLRELKLVQDREKEHRSIFLKTLSDHAEKRCFFWVFKTSVINWFCLKLLKVVINFGSVVNHFGSFYLKLLLKLPTFHKCIMHPFNFIKQYFYPRKRKT